MGQGSTAVRAGRPDSTESGPIAVSTFDYRWDTLSNHGRDGDEQRNRTGGGFFLAQKRMNYSRWPVHHLMASVQKN